MPYTPLFTGGGGIIFSHLVPGEDYELVIEADGYQVETVTISLPLVDDASVTDSIFLKSLSQKNDFRFPKGQYVLAPRAEKEVEHGLDDLRFQKFDSARKHLEKALQMAPGNPYVNYLMGMSYLEPMQTAQAKPFLEKSVSIDPKQPPSLLALGTARFQLADYSGAIEVLEQDVQLDAKSWKAEWMLAGSYVRLRDYAKARDHAEKALQAGKQSAAQVQLILAEALAGLGEREKATNAYENYLSQYPKDPNAAKLRGLVETLRRPPAIPEQPAAVPVATHGVAPAGPAADSPEPAPVTSLGIPTLGPLAELPPKENWAPPDVDAAKPFVISGAACSLSKVMQAAEKNAVQFVTDLQQFSAVEEYQSVEIKRNEQLKEPESGEYDYVVLMEEIRPRFYHVSESRWAMQGTVARHGILTDVGAAARALAFHPSYRDDFDWTCEGLGYWKDKPAWVVHFGQKKDRPTSMLAGFQTPSQLYLLPLKGRAWLSESGDQLVHLETDLTQPASQVGLKRAHFAIDYAPVSFQTHKVKLWLPEDVDAYYQYQGHYLHNYHHYTNFKLFWVGTSQEMGKPKEAKQRP